MVTGSDAKKSQACGFRIRVPDRDGLGTSDGLARSWDLPLADREGPPTIRLPLPRAAWRGSAIPISSASCSQAILRDLSGGWAQAEPRPCQACPRVRPAKKRQAGEPAQWRAARPTPREECNVMKSRILLSLAGVSAAAISAGALAQTPGPTPPAAGSGLIQDAAPEAAPQTPSTALPQTNAAPPAAGAGAFAGDDIIVTARRRTETAQDVPISINAVTGAEIAKLNIRQFEDVATVVPGLTLQNSANGTAGASSLRGIAFDPNASGSNPSVEFYYNDGIISSNVLFTALFDIGQVEVLRGPQGTLRGRASPSGSITIASRQADLNDIGGYVNFTGTNIGAINANGAIGVPIIKDVLAIRLAGIVDHNQGSRVTSINNPLEPFSETEGGRASFRFDPTDTISILGSYQRIKRRIRSFDQVESTGQGPSSPFATNVPINASDRL
ncbi:MAG: TonB-dependent receptor plug domain-containing protein, partial [Sphingomonas sp.]